MPDTPDPLSDPITERAVADTAAALLTALKTTGYKLTHPWADGGVQDVAPALIEADPARREAAALALLEEASVQRERGYDITKNPGDPDYYVSLATDVSEEPIDGTGPDLPAAVLDALGQKPTQFVSSSEDGDYMVRCDHTGIGIPGCLTCEGDDERRCEECQHHEDEHPTGECDVCDCDAFWSPPEDDGRGQMEGDDER